MSKSAAYTLDDVHRFYQRAYGEKIQKKNFSAICAEFNSGIVDLMLKGQDFNMGFNLGYLGIRRVDRDPRYPAIDWAESKKYKEELLAAGTSLYDKDTGKGVKWHVYFTNSYYCRFFWTKGLSSVKNKSGYRFDFTRGVKGNKEKLKRLLQSNDIAYLNFKKYNPSQRFSA